jgi:hypothetical protein
MSIIRASYLMRVHHDVNVGLNVSIQEFSGTVIGNPGIPVSIYINPMVQNKSHEIFTKFFGTYPDTTARIEIATTEPLTISSENLHIELWEFYEPILHLYRTGSLPGKEPSLRLEKMEGTYSVEVSHTNLLQDSALIEMLSRDWNVSEKKYTNSDSTYYIELVPRDFTWAYTLPISILVFAVALLLRSSGRTLGVDTILVKLYCSFKSFFRSNWLRFKKRLQTVRNLINKVTPFSFIPMIIAFSMMIYSYFQETVLYTPFYLLFLFFWLVSSLLYSRALRINVILTVVMLLFTITGRLLSDDSAFMISAVYAFIFWCSTVIVLVDGLLKKS